VPASATAGANDVVLQSTSAGAPLLAKAVAPETEPGGRTPRTAEVQARLREPLWSSPERAFQKRTAHEERGGTGRVERVPRGERHKANDR
jgi:hypothetical protein